MTQAISVAEGYVLSSEPSNFVDILMKDGEHMVIELNPDAAPITVQNFKDLVAKSFYDGLIFHRVIRGFMIQGGDPTGTGMGGSDKQIKGEFTANGVSNPLAHTRGVISMARAMNPNSASSQFFIMHEDSPHLDGQYAAFGRLIFGEACLDGIACCETNHSDKPLEDKVMQKVFFVQPA